MNKWKSVLNELPERLGRPAPKSGVYRPEIDGLRFVAIAVVVFGHLAERVVRFQPPTGETSTLEATIFRLLATPGPGVMLFFAISGFVITHQFMARDEPPLTPSVLRAYLARRAFRIEPPYLLLLCASFLMVSVFGLLPEQVHQFYGEPDSLTASFLASLSYSHGWLFGTMPRLFGPGWTLEIEVQFYLLAPFLCQLYFCTHETRRRLFVFFAVLIASLLLAFLCGPDFLGGNLRFTVFRFAVFFVLGSGFAMFQTQIEALIRAIPPPAARLAPWLGLGLLLVPDPLWPGDGREDLRTFCQVAAVALLFATIMIEGSGLRRLCLGRWPRLLGVACYSLYLTHLHVLHVGAWALGRLHRFESLFLAYAVNAVVLLPLTVIAGLVFYTSVERPLMRRDWPRRTWRVIRRRFARALSV